MNEKILKTVDFQKILQKLSSHGSTSLGKERAEQLRPCVSLVEVKNRLQATDEAYLVERLKGSVPFGGIRDIKGAVHRARIGGILNAAELLDIANTLNGGRRLKKFLLAIAENHSIGLLKGLCSNLSEHKALEDDILSCIDDQAEIMDNASVDLSRIRKELKTGESKVRERLDQMIRTPSIQKMLQDNLITIRNDRYVIPVKQEYRASFGGIIHDQSASGATVFIEPEAIVTLNNKLRELKMKEEREIEKVLQILTSKVEEAADLLVANVEILAELDFIFAKAGLAQEMKATLPIMNDRGFIKLKKGRHPLISGNPVPL
ncbi:MAG TPA: endonuclease MutS2, partial [Bacilli bacterium]